MVALVHLDLLNRGGPDQDAVDLHHRGIGIGLDGQLDEGPLLTLLRARGQRLLQRRHRLAHRFLHQHEYVVLAQQGLYAGGLANAVAGHAIGGGNHGAVHGVQRLQPHPHAEGVKLGLVAALVHHLLARGQAQDAAPQNRVRPQQLGRLQEGRLGGGALALVLGLELLHLLHQVAAVDQGEAGPVGQGLAQHKHALLRHGPGGDGPALQGIGLHAGLVLELQHGHPRGRLRPGPTCTDHQQSQTQDTLHSNPPMYVHSTRPPAATPPGLCTKGRTPGGAFHSHKSASPGRFAGCFTPPGGPVCAVISQTPWHALPSKISPGNAGSP